MVQVISFTVSVKDVEKSLASAIPKLEPDLVASAGWQYFWVMLILSGWWCQPLWKNISQLGLLFPIYGKIKKKRSKPPTSYDYFIWPYWPIWCPICLSSHDLTSPWQRQLCRLCLSNFGGSRLTVQALSEAWYIGDRSGRAMISFGKFWEYD